MALLNPCRWDHCGTSFKVESHQFKTTEYNTYDTFFGGERTTHTKTTQKFNYFYEEVPKIQIPQLAIAEKHLWPPADFFSAESLIKVVGLGCFSFFQHRKFPLHLPHRVIPSFQEQEFKGLPKAYQTQACPKYQPYVHF